MRSAVIFDEVRAQEGRTVRRVAPDDLQHTGDGLFPRLYSDTAGQQ